jgi:nitrate reductase NapD
MENSCRRARRRPPRRVFSCVFYSNQIGNNPLSMHIAGVIVHARPENCDSVAAAIRSMEGAEIHAVENGKMVVTVESDDYQVTSDRVLELHEIDGVLSAMLVYQHGEDDT